MNLSPIVALLLKELVAYFESPAGQAELTVLVQQASSSGVQALTSWLKSLNAPHPPAKTA